MLNDQCSILNETALSVELEKLEMMVEHFRLYLLIRKLKRSSFILIIEHCLLSIPLRRTTKFNFSLKGSNFEDCSRPVLY